MKELRIFFYVQAILCKSFQGMLPIIFSLKRVGRVARNLLLRCHCYCYYCTGVLACIICYAHVCKSQICNSTCSEKCQLFDHMLFFTFVTSKGINQAFLRGVKFMINFVSFFRNSTGKAICLITYAQIWQHGLLQLKDITGLSTGYNLALTK